MGSDKCKLFLFCLCLSVRAFVHFLGLYYDSGNVVAIVCDLSVRVCVHVCERVSERGCVRAFSFVYSNLVIQSQIQITSIPHSL